MLLPAALRSTLGGTMLEAPASFAGVGSAGWSLACNSSAAPTRPNKCPDVDRAGRGQHAGAAAGGAQFIIAQSLISAADRARKLS